MASQFSRAAFSLPGKLMTTLPSRSMQTPRESMARGVMRMLWARMASAMPGTLRLHTSMVASGVTSPGKTAAAAGQNEVGMQVFDGVQKRSRDERALVLHDDVFEAYPAALGDEPLEGGARRIGFEGARVGACDDGECGRGFGVLGRHGVPFVSIGPARRRRCGGSSPRFSNRFDATTLHDSLFGHVKKDAFHQVSFAHGVEAFGDDGDAVAALNDAEKP